MLMSDSFIGGHPSVTAGVIRRGDAMTIVVDMIGISVHDMGARCASSPARARAVPSRKATGDYVETITPNGISSPELGVAREIDRPGLGRNR
jgi:hypothetical protein